MVRTGHGPEGTPAQWHAFADFVRRALHAAADQVEPQADGLEPIRARVGPGLRRRQPAGRPDSWQRRHPHVVKRGTRRGGPGGGAPRR
jgi:hypothetical protein